MTTYCTNLDGANPSSRYTGYDDFNSLFMGHDGNYYGLKADGLYRLDGDDDAGTEIDAYVTLGKQNFGAREQKSLVTAYAGVSSTEPVALTVIVGEDEYTYEARSSSEVLEQQRFDLGRGLKANWFNFKLGNTNGGDFEIADFAVAPMATKRRI